MKQSWKCIIGLAALSLSLTAVWGQSQPWTPPAGAIPSMVADCNGALIRAAADDFVVPTTAGTHVKRVIWWGTAPNAQLFRPFYIAFYQDNGNCAPGPLLARYCLVPTQANFIGNDCLGNPVFKFVARLPAPGFPVAVGGHYWLQISESDVNSLNPNAPDFAWSGHIPVRRCPALVLAPGALFPIMEPCTGSSMDLAFKLVIR